MVEASGAERVGELDRVARALDVGDPVALVVRGHVVDRREVEEVLDVAASSSATCSSDTPSRGCARSPTTA